MKYQLRRQHSRLWDFLVDSLLVSLAISDYKPKLTVFVCQTLLVKHEALEKPLPVKEFAASQFSDMNGGALQSHGGSTDCRHIDHANFDSRRVGR
jgi:hypothetical protein